jgi:uncharacterized membrane protein YdbT with pleckstrin-like domain
VAVERGVVLSVMVVVVVVVVGMIVVAVVVSCNLMWRAAGGKGQKYGRDLT